MTDSELIKLLSSKFGSVKKGNKGWVMIKCPSCTPRDAVKKKRGVNLQTLQTRCFICEEKLTIQDLLGTKIERSEMEEVYEAPEHPQARVIPATGVIPINELPADHPAIKFFLKDHLNKFDSYWVKNKIGFIPTEAATDLIFEHDDRPNTKLSPADSLVFPVYYKDVLVGWQLRYIEGTPNGGRMSKIRYLHLFKKGDYLYNFDNAINYKTVVVVEGVKKALKFPNAVATFGKGISANQIQKLLNWNNIIFLYDGEDDTQKKTQELVAELNVGSKKCICIDPRKFGYDSPDEMDSDTAQKIVFAEWQTQTQHNG